MSVVGIDPSLTAAGIAIGGNPYRPDLYTVGRKGRAGEGYRERCRRVVAQTKRVCALVPADAELVVMEGPSYGSRFGSHMERDALWVGIYSTLDGRGIRIAVCAPTTRAKWASGRGNAGKPEVLTAVRAQWPHVHIADDNQADALTLMSMGAHHLGWSLPFETKPRHTTGLDAIEWPEGVRT